MRAEKEGAGLSSINCESREGWVDSPTFRVRVEKERLDCLAFMVRSERDGLAV